MKYSPYETHSEHNAPNVSIAMIILIVFLVFQFQNQNWPFHTCCNQTQQEDDTTNDQNKSPGLLEDSYLVVVEESESRPVERVKILNDYQFWFGLRDRGLKGFRVLDPDNDDANSFIEEAESQSIQPPFVMHIAKDGKVLDVISFPLEISKIEEMLK